MCRGGQDIWENMTITLSMERISCKEFLFCNMSFFVEEAGCQAREKSLEERDFLLKRWVVRLMNQSL
jgi:hypothetical protein